MLFIDTYWSISAYVTYLIVMLRYMTHFNPLLGDTGLNQTVAAQAIGQKHLLENI